jgi:hypothetical protein
MPRHRLVPIVGLLVAVATIAATVQPARSVSTKAPAGCNPKKHPKVLSVTHRTDLEQQFTDYGNASTHSTWSGGDSDYSITLPDGRWVVDYSDTFLGPVNPDGTRPANVPFIHNSLIVKATDGTLSTITGGTPDNPTSIVSPTDNLPGWYWANAMQVTDTTMNVIYLQFHQTGTGIFDFQWVRNVLVRYATSDLHVIDITQLPSDVANLEWNAWLMPVGSYTYIYGVEDLGNTKYMHIARVSGTNLLGTWSYWTGSGWSTSEAASARITSEVGNNYSISLIDGMYTLITQDQSVPFSNRIVALFSCSPTGPWTNKTVVYTVPEVGQYGTYGNPNIIYYNPHEHPELRSGNNIVLSYDVNSLDTSDTQKDVTIYRPRWLTVSWS